MDLVIGIVWQAYPILVVYSTLWQADQPINQSPMKNVTDQSKILYYTPGVGLPMAQRGVVGSKWPFICVALVVDSY